MFLVEESFCYAKTSGNLGRYQMEKSVSVPFGRILGTTLEKVHLLDPSDRSDRNLPFHFGKTSSVDFARLGYSGKEKTW